MSQFIIKDGTGTGRTARVDSKYRLHVESETFSAESVASLEGLSFTFNLQAQATRITIPDTFDGHVAILQNDDPDRDLFLEQVAFSNTQAGVIFWADRNPVIGTIADNTVGTWTNNNYGSSNTASVTWHIWDETGTAGLTGVTDGDKIRYLAVGTTPVTFLLDGAVILPQGSRIGLGFVNSTGSSTLVDLAVRAYFVPKGTLS